MRIVRSWLLECCPVDLSAEDLAELLTSKGAEVERIERPWDGLDGVVVAKVLEVRDHPNSDKLCLARVSTGSSEREVVVGVRNMVPGDLVPLAGPGARVPALPAALTAREIRGVVSEGMLCSPMELGIAPTHEGILLLGDDLVPRRAVAISLFLVVPLSPASVYVFSATMGLLWLSTVPVTTLHSPALAGRDLFGRAVAISGTQLAVGTPQDDTGATDAGSAYVYDLSGATPTVPAATLVLPGQYSTGNRPPAHQVKVVSTDPDNESVCTEQVQRGNQLAAHPHRCSDVNGRWNHIVARLAAVDLAERITKSVAEQGWGERLPIK
jgi:tRNA-binding EMAP/Myf-like protein